MKKALLFFAVLFLGLQIASAQALSVSGKVTYADDGTPVIGALITVKGTKTATLSDVNGLYKLTIPASATEKALVVSFTGLVPQEKPVVNNNQVVDFSLVTDVNKIDDVVVTAYGTTTKKAFTGTAAVVTDKQIKDLQISSISQAIQGLATGVIAVNTNGQPGSNSTIRVRGIGSFTSATTDSKAGEPLLVVDGIPYNGDMSTINTNDVESMTILKDANSTALYGSRAANGVIMITTKSGRSGKAKVTAQASYGLSSRAVPNYKYADAANYMELRWLNLLYDQSPNGQITAAAGQFASDNLLNKVVYNPYNTGINSPIGPDGKLIPGAKLMYDQNWYDELTRVGQRQEYNVQVAGGSDFVKYMISMGMIDDQGVITTSGFKRYNVRGKIDADVRKWLKMGLNMSFGYSDQSYPMQAGTYNASAINFYQTMPNIYPAYMMDKNGQLVKGDDGNYIPDDGRGTHTGIQGKPRPVLPGYNPLLDLKYDETNYNRVISSNQAYLEASFLRDFKFRSTLGVEYYLLNGYEFKNALYGDGKSYGGMSRKERTISTTITFQNFLTYDKTIGDKHHVNAMIGAESYDFGTNFLRAERQGFDFPGQTEMDYAANITKANSNATGTRSMRYIARGQYDYDNRLHFSASYAYDGTSRFAQGQRWGSFYSVGASWNISSEKWFAPVSDWFSNLKVRASYGTSGNDKMGYFPYMGKYEAGWNILGNLGSVISTLSNNDLSWESQAQLDMGVDVGFLNGALNLGVTYFDRRSENLLMARPLPPSSGISSINDNIGKIQNSGVEVEINANIINRPNIVWTAGFNISYLKNKVMALPESAMTNGMANPASSYKWLTVGESAYTWYMYDFAGVDPTTGLPTWYQDVKDPATGAVTGKTTTTTYGDATRYKMKSSLPDFTGGISTNFSIYGVEIGIIGSFSIGGTLLDMDKAGLMNSSASGQYSVDMNNAWRKPGDITNVPTLGSTDRGFQQMSSRWFVDGSYFRLRNLTIGYNFANLKSVKQFGMDNLRIFCAMDNLFTIFGAQGLDPEQGLGGITDTRSSAMKTISFGINIGF